MNDGPARCGVIGFPLAHTRSPELHKRFAEQCGIAQTYAVLATPENDFEQVVKAFFAAGGRGLNVTLPFKARALALADSATERATRAGAANVLIRQDNGAIGADNVDGIGFMRDLARLGFDVRGTRVCVLGAGGAAAGVVDALLSAEAAVISISNRHLPRAQRLAERFANARVRVAVPGEQAQAVDLLVNATSASLAAECPDFSIAVVGPGTLAYDLVYAREPTPFMRRAAGHGARTRDGWGMLVEQAAQSFHIWHGVRPDPYL